MSNAVTFARAVLLALILLSGSASANEEPSLTQTIDFIEQILPKGKIPSLSIDIRIKNVQVDDTGHFTIVYKTWGLPLIRGELQRVSHQLKFDISDLHVNNDSYIYKCWTGSCISITDQFSEETSITKISFKTVNDDDTDRLYNALAHLKSYFSEPQSNLFR